MCAKANGRPVQAAVYVGLKIAKKFDAICPVQPISLGGGVTGYHLRDLDAWIDGLKLVPPDKRAISLLKIILLKRKISAQQEGACSEYTLDHHNRICGRPDRKIPSPWKQE
jgi:hypothetical protein